MESPTGPRLCPDCQKITFSLTGFHERSSQKLRSFDSDHKPFLNITWPKFYPFRTENDCQFCKQICRAFPQNVAQSPSSSTDSPFSSDSLRHYRSFVASLRGYPSEFNDGSDTVQGYLVKLEVYSALSDTEIVFQRCQSKPLRLSQVFERQEDLDFPIPDTEPFEGRIRELRPDWRLFRQWRRLCDKEHRSCRNISAGSRPSWIRLIDVWDRCIVETLAIDSWVTLSYVWGGEQPNKLTKSNLASYLQPGSLAEHILPATINDAITATQQLHERYLWVDALCICQDDLNDQAIFIDQMSQIYGLSSTTIVAANGQNAETGLAGVSKLRRQYIQESFAIGDVHLVDVVNGWVQSSESDLMQSKKEWRSRAWTFQEELCSRRRLFFTKELVYWQCSEASWSEDNCAELTGFAPLRPLMWSNVWGHTPGSQDISSDLGRLDTYPALVDQYSTRELGRESDYLDAFTGVLALVERKLSHGFIWALPTPQLTSSLLWAFSSFSGGRRRETTTFVKAPRGHLICAFPSWTWVGWRGTVCYLEWECELVLPAVDYYRLDFHGSPILVPQAKTVWTPAWLADYSAEHEMPRVVQRSMLPTPSVSREIAQTVLCFWAATAVLSYGTYSDRGRDLRDCVFQDAQLLATQETRYELPPCAGDSRYNAKFIVIGHHLRHREEGRSPRQELAALVVTLTDDDQVDPATIDAGMYHEGYVRYRMGWVWIPAENWRRCDWRWELILLG